MSNTRRGVTLIELLMCIGLMALLIALMLPAIQGSREAARRASCASNLRAIGQAIHSYHSSFNSCPPLWGMPNSRPNALVDMKQFSYISHLLPALDAVPLYNAVNFEVALSDPYLFPVSEARGFDANTTAASQSLAVLLCPSDPGHRRGWTAGTNYRANLGVERWFYSTGGPFMDRYTTLSFAATTDGLSHTVGVGEKLRGFGLGQNPNPRTDMFVGARGRPLSVEESLRACGNLPIETPSYSTGGLMWMLGSLSQTCYNHTLQPNATLPDCIAPLLNPISGHIALRSNHRDIVLVTFMDGSVQPVSNTIDPSLWQALGTRNGGEALPLSW